MKTEEYMTEIGSDGFIPLPKDIVRSLELEPHTRVKIIIERVDMSTEKEGLSYEAKKKALAIREFISDMGPDDLSEKFREKYK